MVNDLVSPPFLEPHITSDLHLLMSMTGANLSEAEFCLGAASWDIYRAIQIFEQEVARGNIADRPPDPGPGALALPWWDSSFWSFPAVGPTAGGPAHFRRFVDTTIQLVAGAVIATVFFWIKVG